MQFTPQQLAGAGRYSHKTRIGNWCEDLAIEEVKLNDFMSNKRNGTLLTMQAGIQQETSLQPVPLTFAREGILRFGDSIKIQSLATNGTLACNIFERNSQDGESFAASCAPAGSKTTKVQPSCARNTFVLEKWPKYNYPDDILRVGQPFLLGCNPSLRVDKKSGMLRNLAYLSSRIVDTNRFAKMSNHQEVCFQGGDLKYSMVWTAVNVANRRYQTAGGPVMANQPIVFSHKATNTPLACDPNYSCLNDFGNEYEVAGHQYLKYGKTLNLINEKDGLCTGEVRQRAELAYNQWAIVTASTADEAIDRRKFVKMTPEVVLERICNAIKSRGSHGFRGLARLFNIIDDRGNGVLDAQEFRFGLIDFGIDLPQEEFDMVQKVFDVNGDGFISFTEFLQTIQGPLPPNRAEVIRQAYDVLDKNHDGVLTKADLAGVYDAAKHPDVVSNRKTEGEILEEFLSHWDTEKADGIISWSEFERYYRDMSAGIDSDEYFQAMVAGAYGLSSKK